MPKVFFSWQSDQPRQSCKDVVRNALDAAAIRLNSEVSEADRLEVTSDTQGVSGSPEIFNTICERIDECDVFVADLTVVATLGSDQKRKALPNSNVLIEYGYALKSKGRLQLVSVWNTAFFSPIIEELPFNLKHARAPYAFVLDSNSNPGAVLRTTKRLEEFFYEAIRSALKSSSSEVKPVEFLGQTAIENDSSTFLPVNGVLTRDGDFSGQSLKVVLEANKGNIYARLIPKRALDITKSEIRSRIKGAPGLAIATGSSSGSFGNNEFGYVNYATLNNASTEKRTVLDFVQFFRSGEVWCVNGSALSGGGDISESIIGIINKMWGVLNDWLETSAPDEKYSLVVGISGLRGRRIAYGSLNHQKTSQFYVDHVSAVFEEPRGITTQEIKEALWKEIDSEL